MGVLLGILGEPPCGTHSMHAMLRDEPLFEDLR